MRGTLELRHGDGIYLRSLPNESGHLMELMTQRHRLPAILEAREALETQLAALAAARRTMEDVAEMSHALDVMTADIDSGGFGEEGDRLFHEAVTRAARSPLLADFMAGLAVPISETRHSSLGEPGRPPRSLRAHHQILEAIRRGDGAGARQAMRRHENGGRHRPAPMVSRPARWRRRRSRVRSISCPQYLFRGRKPMVKGGDGLPGEDVT